MTEKEKELLRKYVRTCIIAHAERKLISHILRENPKSVKQDKTVYKKLTGPYKGRYLSDLSDYRIALALKNCQVRNKTFPLVLNLFITASIHAHEFREEVLDIIDKNRQLMKHDLPTKMEIPPVCVGSYDFVYVPLRGKEFMQKIRHRYSDIRIAKALKKSLRKNLWAQ
jgi:mRNA-degrading endonuclease RelE of RelBE toxin-antitoxin system